MWIVSAPAIWCGQSELFQEIESSLGPSTRLSLCTSNGLTERFESSLAPRNLPVTLDLFPLNVEKQAVKKYASNPKSDRDTLNLSLDDVGGSSRLTTFPLMSGLPNQLETPKNSKKRENEIGKISRDTADAYRRVAPKTSHLSHMLSQPDISRTIGLPSNWKPWGDMSCRPPETSAKLKEVNKLENCKKKNQLPVIVPQRSNVPSQPYRGNTSLSHEQNSIHNATQPKQSKVAHVPLGQHLRNVKDNETKSKMKITHPSQTEIQVSDKDVVFEYYSHQTWLEAPGKLDKQASFISHILAVDLLKMISNFVSIHEELDKMQNSHNILLPFTYKLILKGLNQNRWNRIKRVWEFFWKYNDNTGMSRKEDILRTYVWISDYIHEVTLPNLYRSSPRLLRGRSIFLLTPHARLIREISISNQKRYHLRVSYLKELVSKLHECFQGEVSARDFRVLEKDKVIKLHESVLEMIHYVGGKIAACSDIDRRNPSTYKMMGFWEAYVNQMLHEFLGKSCSLVINSNPKRYPQDFVKYEELLGMSLKHLKSKEKTNHINFPGLKNFDYRIQVAFLELSEEPQQSKKHKFKYLPERINIILRKHGLI